MVETNCIPSYLAYSAFFSDHKPGFYGLFCGLRKTADEIIFVRETLDLDYYIGGMRDFVPVKMFPNLDFLMYGWEYFEIFV